MKKWFDNFNYNPVEPLINHKCEAIALSAKRDLLNEKKSLTILWQDPEAQKIIRRQNKNGSWLYPAAKEQIRTKENYNQIETYRNLGYLIEQFGFTKKHVSIQNAAEYLFRFQSKEGDFRGIYGNQYSPNYTAGITELLVKAGYEKDVRIKKVFDWLISVRQTDGGWAIPFRTRNFNLNVISDKPETLKPDYSKPFSHMVTGVVLRAFAVHSSFKNAKEAEKAGKLLTASLFKKDNYPDRAGAEYWLRFTFPFWFTDLISAMDTISLLDISKHEPAIDKAIVWFIKQQKQNGMWELKILKGRNKNITNAWLSLAICRIVKRILGE
jgi:Squalene-hopene cyclase C-terminal domain